MQQTVLQLMKEEPQPSNEDCIIRIQEDLPIDNLFNYLTLDDSGDLYEVIRDYVSDKGFDYCRHPYDTRSYTGLAH